MFCIFFLIQFFADFFLNFYCYQDTTWCGNCKRVRPEYVEAAQQLLAEGSVIRLAAVDVEADRPLGERFDIRGIPSFRLFVDGELKEYDGGQSAGEFVHWLKRVHSEL